MDRCKVRMECHSDFGDYSEILGDLARILKHIKPKQLAGEKVFVAKTLRTNLTSIYTLVQSHYMNGHSGIAAVLYNELSGLAGSSMIRRVSKVLRDSVGKPRGGRGGSNGGRVDPAPAPQGGVPLNARRGSFGGRGNYNMGRGPGRGNFNMGRGGHANNNGFPRPPMRCFECHEPGHRYQECRNRNRQNQNPQ